MKKTIISIVVLTLLIIPTVASAAWYNPLTWFHNWSFGKKLIPKTEVVENIESKQEQKSVETNPVLTPSTSPTVLSPKLPNVQQTGIAKDAADMYLSETKLIDQEIGLLQMIIDSDTKYIDAIGVDKAVVVEMFEIAGSSSLNEKAKPLLNNFYEPYMTSLINHKASAEAYVKLLQQRKMELNQKAVNISTANANVTTLVTIQSSNKQFNDEFEKKLHEFEDSQESLRKKYLEGREKISEVTDTLIKNFKNSNQTSSPSYTRPSSSQTNCFMTDYGTGGMMTCYNN